MEERKVVGEFCDLILKGEFFEANEVLEGVWKKLPKGSLLKKAYQGVINGAVALELKKRGRESYRKIWEVYLKYRGLALSYPHLREPVLLLDLLSPVEG
ncbi:MAG: DUF309 domain-containing protein [Campylobacterales bacterium]